MNNDYLMGLLTADGSQKRYITKNGELHVSMVLELKDRDILDKLSVLSNSKVNERIRQGKYKMYYMTFSYKYLGDNGKYFDKKRTGIYQYYKQCNNKVDFIRGLFDGDGGICKRLRSKDSLPYWSIYFVINSQQLEIKDIIDDFCKEYNFIFSIYFDKRGVGCYNYSLSKKTEIQRFYQIIYQNKPNLYLNRKYQKFLESGCPKIEIF